MASTSETRMIQTANERRRESAIEWLNGVLSGMREDLDRMLANHPPSRRGSRYQNALESLESRLNAAIEEVQEVNDAK
jgi:hypothetical protein